jgi:hypothetical protein
VQVLADPFGKLLWASPALPGAIHDVRAAREHGLVDALARADVTCWADKGYRSVGGTIRTPCWERRHTLSAGRQAVNRSHAKIRALVEQAMAPSSGLHVAAALPARTPSAQTGKTPR